MTTFEKHYIGKGTQVENLDIIKIVLPLEGLEEATVVYAVWLRGGC